MITHSNIYMPFVSVITGKTPREEATAGSRAFFDLFAQDDCNGWFIIYILRMPEERLLHRAVRY